MTSSLKRRLDKLGPELPTFEEWLGPDGWIKMESEEEKDARKRGRQALEDRRRAPIDVGDGVVGVQR